MSKNLSGHSVLKLWFLQVLKDLTPIPVTQILPLTAVRIPISPFTPAISDMKICMQQETEFTESSTVDLISDIPTSRLDRKSLLSLVEKKKERKKLNFGVCGMLSRRIQYRIHRRKSTSFNYIRSKVINIERQRYLLWTLIIAMYCLRYSVSVSQRLLIRPNVYWIHVYWYCILDTFLFPKLYHNNRSTVDGSARVGGPHT